MVLSFSAGGTYVTLACGDAVAEELVGKGEKELFCVQDTMSQDVRLPNQSVLQ